MRKAVPMLLLIGSVCASVYAWWFLARLVGLAGNEIRHYKSYWAWDLSWLLFAAALTIGFAITARGRWRFAAVLPLVICAVVAFVLVGLRPYASA